MVADIHLGNVSKTFPAKAGKVEALGGINLDVGRHEFVSVLGPSGCGKSTLLRAALAHSIAGGGDVLVRGQKIDGPSAEVGIVFQSPVLLPWRTVLENIELQVEVRHLDRAASRQKARELISLVGLDGFADSYPYQLSGGMQQRVSLCRALIHDPSLLLMDEPFGALDAMTREHMGLELQRVWMERQKTVLFITHSIAEAVFLSDRIVVMSARPGRIEEIITVDIPRPRGMDAMKDPRFHTAVDRARKLMHAAGLPE